MLLFGPRHLTPAPMPDVCGVGTVLPNGVTLAGLDHALRDAERTHGVLRRESAAMVIGLSLLTFVTGLFASRTRGMELDTTTATGSVEGTVFIRNSAGDQSVIARATVRLNGPGTFETQTDENGNYVFQALPPGTYELAASSPGLQVRQTVRVEAGKTRMLLELKPLEVASAVVVNGDEPENRDSATSGTVSDKTLRDAPNVNERFEGALPLIPGVVRGADGHVNLKGTRNTQSGALVNSANVTDPVTGSPAINLPVDVVASVQVISNPYDPQYGRFTGAVSSV